MRWVRLWCLLASAYLAGRLLSAYWITGSFEFSASLWTQAAVVPLVQVAALAPLLMRRGRRVRRSQGI